MRSRPGAEPPERPVPARRTLHGRVTLLAGLAFGTNGLILGILSLALLGLRDAWHLSPPEVGALTMAAGAGQLIGGAVLGYAADWIGRRAGFGITVALSSLATGAAALAPSLPWLVVLMFLSGCGFGGVAPVAASLVGEFAPREHRGAQMGWTQVIWTVGWIAAAAGGLGLGHGMEWRGIFALGLAPIVLAIAGPRLVPESPRFLIAHGRRRAAEALAADLRTRYGAAPDLPTQESARSASFVAHLREVWEPRFRRRSFMLWTVWFVMIGAFQGPVVWLPAILSAGGFAHPAEATFGIALAMMPFVVASTLLLDRVGRKPVIIAALGLAGAGAAVIARAHTEEAVILGGGMLAGGVLAAWPVILSYAAELYPTRIRATATGLASAAGRSAGVVSPALLAVGIPQWSSGHGPVFVIYAAALVAAAAVVLLAGEETAGRTLEEISERPDAAAQPAGP